MRPVTPADGVTVRSETTGTVPGPRSAEEFAAAVVGATVITTVILILEHSRFFFPVVP